MGILKWFCRRPEHEDMVVRRGAMRTALDLFASHSTLFSDQVLIVLDVMGFAVLCCAMGLNCF